MTRPLRIAFVRPRLGIGGSERLILDAALELRARGHTVVLFVPDRLEAPQFDAVRRGELEIRTNGAFIPERIGDRVVVPCAIVRCAYASLGLAGRGRQFDVVVADITPAIVPWIKRVSGSPVLFYCHFPDLLLTAPMARQGRSYRLYRWPLDRLEAHGLRSADRLIVNSRFIESVVRRTFPDLTAPLDVLYPGVTCRRNGTPPPTEVMLLAIGRFDPRKNIGLAVDTLVRLRDHLPAHAFSRVRLTIAGRFDESLPEHRRTLTGLRERARNGGVADQVEIVPSPSDDEQQQLLQRCLCVIYTPVAEHFGYVPLEAMAAARPVVASRLGGPAETVVNGVTGILVEPTAEAFASAVAPLVANPAYAMHLGRAGQAHVAEHFSRGAFGARLEAILTEVADGFALRHPRRRPDIRRSARQASP